MEHISHNLSIPDGVEQFFHTGVTFDEKLYEVTFSEEARAEFQQFVDRIQSSFIVDHDDTETGGSDTKKSHGNMTPEDMATAVDGMIVAGKGKKAVKKFMDRVKNVLGKKKKGEKYAESREKIEKQVEKYRNHPRVQVTIQYSEGADLKNLADTPITVWPGQDIHTMLASLNVRLRFKQLISSKKIPN